MPENSDNKPRGLYFSKALFEGLILGGAYIRRGLSTEGNLCFRIDWASLLVGRKFIVFALFLFVFEGHFHVQAPPGGAYIWGRGGDLTEVFCVTSLGGLYMEGLIFGILRYLNLARSCSKGILGIESHCERISIEPPGPTSEILYLLLCLQDKTRPNCLGRAWNPSTERPER